MAISKVEIMENGNARSLIDLTNDTVTSETLAEGETAHNSKGELITGTMKQTTSGSVKWEDIENKPFFEEERAIIDQNMEFQDMDGMFCYIIEDFPFDLSNYMGKTVKVTFGNEIYECKVENVYGMPCIGNYGLVFGGSDSGVPFFFMTEDGNCLIADLYAQESRTVYVKVESNVLKKLDKKYLDGVPTMVTLYLSVDDEIHLSKDEFSQELITKQELLDLCNTDNVFIVIKTNWTTAQYCTPLTIEGFINDVVPAKVYYMDKGEIKICYTSEYIE